jgi:hypothetical protein
MSDLQGNAETLDGRPIDRNAEAWTVGHAHEAVVVLDWPRQHGLPKGCSEWFMSVAPKLWLLPPPSATSASIATTDPVMRASAARGTSHGCRQKLRLGPSAWTKREVRKESQEQMVN